MKKNHYLRVFLSLMVVISMLVSLVPATVSAAAPDPVTIIASTSSKTTPGDLGYLYTGYYGGAVENAAVKFDLSTTAGTPTSASLQINVNLSTCTGTSGAFNLLGGIDDSWVSPNLPSNMTSGTTLIKSNVNYGTLVNGWNTIDVTSFVQNHLAADATRIVSLYMMGIASTVNNDISMYSAQNADLAPRLILSYSSDEARLSSINISGVSVPDFAPDTLSYSFSAAFGTDLSALAITSAATDSGATQSAWTYDSANKKWSVTVTARDGTTKKTYSVTVSNDIAKAAESSKTSPGDVGYLYVGYYNGAVENAAVKFNLSAGSGTPASAVLQIYVRKTAPQSTGTAGAFDLVGGTDDTWTSPALPADMSTGITAIRSNITYSGLSEGWNSIDVTSYVQSHLAVDSSKIVSLYLKGIASTENNDISIDSAQSTTTGPRLVMTYGTNEARLSAININGTTMGSFAIDTYNYNYAAIIGSNLANLVFSSTTFDSNASQSAWTYDSVNHVWSVTVTAKDGTTRKTYNVHVSISDTVAAVSSSKTTSGDPGFLYVGYFKDISYPGGVDENAAVKFDLSGCTTTPTKVTLKLYVNKSVCTGTAGAFAVYGSSDDSWIAPALPLSSSLEASPIRSNITFSDLVSGWNDIDVTNFVQSQFASDSTKIITLYLKGVTNTVSNDIAINSASTGSYAPSLNVSFASSEARLSGVTIGGTALTGFSADTYSYNYVAPHDTNLSTMAFGSSVLEPNASQGAWAYDTGSHTWSVTVTAQDTTTVKTYSVSVSAALESSDASLSSISIDGTPLAEFSSSTLNYTYFAVHNTMPGSLLLSSVKNDHMAVQSGWTYNATDKKWSNTVTAEDGVTKIYTVTISVIPDTDATLTGIQVDGTDIAEFASSVLDYTVDVSHGTVITAASFVSETNDINATLGTWTYDEAAKKWSVLVKAEDGVTQKTYSVTINERKSTDATLKSISVNGTAVGNFSPTTLDYTFDVVHGTLGSTLSLVSAVNDHMANPGTWIYDSVDHIWSVTVIAEDGVTSLPYTVTINELKSTDADLKSITVGGAAISEFLPSTLDYTYKVVHGTVITDASFVSEANDHMAQQGIWEYSAVTGKWSVVVTAEDGETIKTYTVTIYELPDTDATLKSIGVAGTDIAGFSSEVVDYTVNVVHGTVITAASFASETTDVNAVQGTWSFDDVSKKWSVLVKAEDDKTNLTYTVTINEQSSKDATLSSIQIGGTVISGFEPSTLGYTYNVVHGTDGATLSMASEANDHMAQQGTWTYDTASHSWSVTVKAEDGVTSLTYTVTVNVLPDIDATLKSLTVNGTAVSSFLPTTLDYTYTVAHETLVTAASFASAVTDNNASQGTWTYSTSTGKWSVLVTAEDGKTQNTYTVTINRLPDTDANLKSIRIGGTIITGFSPLILDYTYNAAHGTVITAASILSAASDKNAVQGAWKYSAVTGKWSVLVTAEDGKTQKTYSIRINELASTDASLKNIKIGGIALAGFSPSTLIYTYDVAHGTDISSLKLTSLCSDHMASQGTWKYSASADTWSVTVTAQDKLTKRTYVVAVNELALLSKDASLKNIRIGGTSLAGFSPSTLAYTYTAAYKTDLAGLVFTSTCSSANAVQSPWTYDSVNHKWSVTVTAQDKTVQKTYSVTVVEGANPAEGLGDYRTNTLLYQSHVQDIGWQDAVRNGVFSGTTAQSKRLEAIRINLKDIPGGIEYCTHVQDIGWMDWSANGNMSGTIAQSKRLEALKIRLTGEAAEKYDIYYRVHVQDIGWMDWAKNGESAGTAACSYRMESMQIVMVLKGDPAPGPTAKAFYNGFTGTYNEQ